MASNYWEERALEAKRNQLATSKRYERELKERMKLVERAIDEQIKKFVAMFADSKGISLEDANRVLSTSEMNQWEQSLEKWKEMAISPEYEYLYRKKMDAQYSKAQYTRLEALRRQTFELLAHHASLESEYFGRALANEFGESYYRNVFNIQDQQGVYKNFQQFNEPALQAVIAQNWQGSNFSKRIWGNYTETLPSYLETAFTRGVALGYGVDDMVREAKVVFRDFSNHNLHRLINTEFGHIQETATESAYNETDLERYRYLATLEAKTCEVCGGLDYKVFNVKDIERGKNYPLIHPNCRCTTTPYIPEMDEIKGTRFARDPETGARMKVPKMSFDEWKKWQVDNSSKELIGLTTPDNVKIAGVSLHIKERMFERSVDKRHVSDAITNPLQIKEKPVDELGRKSRKYIGEHATIAINPDTGYLLTTYPTGSSVRRRLLNARKDSN